MMKCIDRLSKDPIREDNNNQLSVSTGLKQKERKKKKTQNCRTMITDDVYSLPNQRQSCRTMINDEAYSLPKARSYLGELLLREPSSGYSSNLKKVRRT